MGGELINRELVPLTPGAVPAHTLAKRRLGGALGAVVPHWLAAFQRRVVRLQHQWGRLRRSLAG
jgi:hypothetical protein